MSETLTLELTPKQRELVLRGLRFVRSSRLLEIREPADVSQPQRNEELEEIRRLSDLLGAAATKSEPAKV